MAPSRHSDLAFSSATDLMAAMESGEVSSLELLEMYLGRIDSFNTRINAVVTLDAGRARVRAAAADAARTEGVSWGPLHGLPVTIKDELEVEGVRSTYGALEHQDHVSTYEGESVAKLRAAGAVIFGKSNLPAYSADLQSYNEVFGTTVNPWDASRTPGGSSGGSAAAVAAGLTGMDLGTDMGGSIRIPAGWCGVYGHKPTAGLVSQTGDVADEPHLGYIDLFTHGPMGRSAEDLRLELDVIRTTRFGTQLSLPEPAFDSLKGVRVAAWIDDPDLAVASEAVEVMAAAVAALEGAGCVVDHVPPIPMPTRQMIDLWESLFGAAGWAGMDDEIERVAELAARPGNPHPIAGTMVTAARMSHSDWLAADERRKRLGAAWSAFFESYDILLCPVSMTTAPEHRPDGLMQERELVVNGINRPYWENFTWAGLTTLGNLSATSAPVGTASTGLPVGIQVAGPAYADYSTIEFAKLMAEVVGGFRPPPGLEGGRS